MTDEPMKRPRDTAEDILGPLSKLQARLADAAKAAGLHLVNVAVIPSHKPDGNHTLQAVFVPSDEPPPPDDETADLLEGIAEATRREEQEARAEQARKDLLDLADETRGDDDPPDRGMGPRSRGIGLDD